MRIHLKNISQYDTIYIAFSGGIDSVVLTDFMLKFTKPYKKKIVLLHFNHGELDIDANNSENYATLFANAYKLKLHCGRPSREKRSDESLEEYWRNERYSFLNSFRSDRSICLLGHNLDDVVETWIFSSLHGNPKIMQYNYNDWIIRPILNIKREEIQEYFDRNGLIATIDLNNQNVNFPRIRIRKEIIPLALKINPGLHTTILGKLKLP